MNITVLEQDIVILEGDYISLTDIAKLKNKFEPKDVIKNWLKNKDTIAFLGLWEKLNNNNFKGVEFDPLLKEAGYHSFVISTERWIKTTNSIGILAKRGKNGGTYAHKDIALHFASWISPEINLYIIKEFQRLKEKEQTNKQWSIKREIAKINYQIHTDAIKENLIIPKELSKNDINRIYASEADLLNMAVFGITAKEWKNLNPTKIGNIRDYASISQLICLSNLENINAYLIDLGIPQSDRLLELNKIAIKQITTLINNKLVNK